METIAIISQLLQYVFALAGVTLCVILFRHYRQFAWLLVSATFFQPFWILLFRAMHGRQLFTFASVGVTPEGFKTVSYRVDFPLFYFVAILGLYLLVRKARHETVA